MSAGKVVRGLYAITPDEPDTKALLCKVTLVLRGGAQILQYRNKLADNRLRRLQAAALRELTKEFPTLLIINDDASLAQQIGADGVHLGREDGDVAGARRLLGKHRYIGVSCYNRIELARQAEREGADYVAFGAFFPSQVKPGAVAASTQLLQQARRNLKLPIVAIGGITLANGRQLIENGADALAVISGVFGATDIEAAARRFSALDFS
jgi:thiamine-phosphate pyrophosphorylase